MTISFILQDVFLYNLFLFSYFIHFFCCYSLLLSEWEILFRLEIKVDVCSLVWRFFIAESLLPYGEAPKELNVILQCTPLQPVQMRIMVTIKHQIASVHIVRMPNTRSVQLAQPKVRYISIFFCWNFDCLCFCYPIKSRLTSGVCVCVYLFICTRKRHHINIELFNDYTVFVYCFAYLLLLKYTMLQFFAWNLA